MRHKVLIVAMSALSFSLMAANNSPLQQQVALLKQQTIALQKQLDQLQRQINHSQNKSHKGTLTKKTPNIAPKKAMPVNSSRLPSGKRDEVRLLPSLYDTSLTVHQLSEHPESLEFYPTALMANEHVVTFIAGTPVVTSPYLGDRPAFDGSDYIVNISSINRDIRLMQQRRRLYQAYKTMGYPAPDVPIIAISGKIEALATTSNPYFGHLSGDVNLGSSELDAAASLNQSVEGFMSVGFGSPALISNQRVANSALFLNMGFINIGDLDRSPLYFTAGQLYVPYGRYSSAMISPTLPMILTRTKARPFILGYKSQQDTGPFAAIYGFRSDTTLGRAGVGGANLGYVFDSGNWSGEIGGGYIGSIDDSAGMQLNDSSPMTTFAGFGSFTNGSESVSKVPGVNLHGNISFDRYSLTAEWVTATKDFRTQDLSFNGIGASPSAAQLEAGMTFKLFDKPASIGASYQWTNEALALNLPKQSISGVFNISLWKDTVESLEYRHDIDYSQADFANGSAPAGVVNLNTYGTGQSSETVTAQIGVYF